MLVPITYGALLYAAWRIAARLVPPGEQRLLRATATAVLVPLLSLFIVIGLGAVSALAALPFVIACLAVAGLAHVATRGLPPSGDAQAIREGLAALARDPVSLAFALVASVALGLAVLSTYLLVPWAWDAVGYHLPIVHDALATGTLREVPTNVIYVNAYPRLVDLSFIAWRISVGTEDWIELAQLPFVPAAVLSIATIAARGGVPAHRGIAFGALFLAIPVAMLELPSAYIDVAVAALALASFTFVTAPLARGTLVMSALTAGVLLGSKPSAPPIVALALLTLLFRCHREKLFKQGLFASIGALAIGSSKYLENLARHGNPIWPVELRLGPLVFPGDVAMAELAVTGLPEPYHSMGWLGRVASSWTALPDRYIYDMRLGGLGPLFLFGLLPAALLALVAARRPDHDRSARPGSSEAAGLPRASRHIADLRERLAGVALPIAAVCIAALMSPGAHWARYTLAVPGALLALAAVMLEGLPTRARIAGSLVLLALAAWGIGVSFPGLSAGGPDLFTLAAMGEDERMRAFAMDEQELDWDRAREAVGPGEAFGYDPSYGLPGRLVRRDGASRVAYFSEASPTWEALDRWLTEEHVRVVVLGDPGSAELARAHPDRLRERFRSLYPSWQPCAVFDVLGP